MSTTSRARRTASWIAGQTLGARRLAGLGRRFGLRGVVLNYHIMRSASMRAHLDVLQELFELLPLDEVVARASRAPAPGSRVPAALTFDDGKRTHLTEVAPVLRERGVHASFFVTAGPCASDGLHWFDLAERARQGFEALLADPAPTGERAALRGALVARFGALLRPRGAASDPGAREVEFDRWKRMDATARDASIGALAEALGVSPRPLDDDERALTPAEVGELARQGFLVGSHSVSHPILTLESPERVLREVSESRAAISDWIGAPVRHFCYPNGNASDETEAATRRAGYDAAWVTDPLWLGGRENPHRLPRVQIFEHYDRSEIALKLALSVARVLPNPDGTGLAYRARRTGRAA